MKNKIENVSENNNSMILKNYELKQMLKLFYDLKYTDYKIVYGITI